MTKAIHRATQISAKIIRDSISPDGHRLTTVEATFPKFLNAELNTHRAFSRNLASSRAIPSKRILEQVENDPYMPIWYGANMAGMQAPEEIKDDDKWRVREILDALC